MKKIFALAMAMVSMVAVMTSCNNDDAEFIGQQAPAPKQEVTEQVRQTTELSLMVAVTNEQMNYLDETYVVEIDGKKQEVKVEDMTPATQEQICALTNSGELAESFESTAKYLVYNFGEIESNQTAKIVEHKIELKDNNQNEEFDYLLTSCFISGNKMVSQNINLRLFKGVYSNDANLQEFFPILNAYEAPIVARL